MIETHAKCNTIRTELYFNTHLKRPISINRRASTRYDFPFPFLWINRWFYKTGTSKYPNLFQTCFIYSVCDVPTPKTIEPFRNPGHPSAATNPSRFVQDSGFVRVNWKMCDYLSTWMELVHIFLSDMFSDNTLWNEMYNYFIVYIMKGLC